MTRSFEDDPALDVAVSRAVMLRVAAGELPETLRLARPGGVGGLRQARRGGADGYDDAVRRRHAQRASTRCCGWPAAGRRSSTRTRSSSATPCPTRTRVSVIHERFERTAARIARALAGLGVDARVGEVPGEYCPGRYSVNACGVSKLAGIGQRVVAGGSHTGVGAGGGGRGARSGACSCRSTPRSALDWGPRYSGCGRERDARGDVGGGPRRTDRPVLDATSTWSSLTSTTTRWPWLGGWHRSTGRRADLRPAGGLLPPARPGPRRPRSRPRPRPQAGGRAPCPVSASAPRRGMARAVATPPRNGHERVVGPWITTVGTRSSRSRAVRSPDAMIAASWRAVPAGTDGRARRSRPPVRGCAPRPGRSPGSRSS